VFAESVSLVSRFCVGTILPLPLLLSQMNSVIQGIGLLEVGNVTQPECDLYSRLTGSRPNPLRYLFGATADSSTRC
jgi:hypothetical protein